MCTRTDTDRTMVSKEHTNDTTVNNQDDPCPHERESETDRQTDTKRSKTKRQKDKKTVTKQTNTHTNKQKTKNKTVKHTEDADKKVRITELFGDGNG